MTITLGCLIQGRGGGLNNWGGGGSENITDTNKWGWDGQLELELEEIC